MPDTSAHMLEQAYRDHWVRLLAMLTREFRNLDLAEDALGEAFTAAASCWPGEGAPANAGAWLLTTARRRAIDRLRRDDVAARRLPLLIVDEPPARSGAADDTVIDDDRLRLIFTCCHPALSTPAQVALTLRCIAGTSTGEIASLFLVSEPTMAARLTRAKKKIAVAGVPYRVPGPDELPDRLQGVLGVVYLVFTTGYAARTGRELLRVEIASEAIRLARLLAALMPHEPDVSALLALMLFQHARRDARFDAAGDLVRLPDQDRNRWHADEIREATWLLRSLSRRGVPPTRYLLEARIAAEHSVAQRADDTNWRRIAELYDLLERLTGSPIVRLNRAVAVAEIDGPQAALTLVKDLDDELPRHHMLPATRAELLRRLGRRAESLTHYDRAIALADTDTERRFLERRRAQTGGGDGADGAS